MSYDISFRVRVEGKPDVYIPVGECVANITYNLGDMIRAATGLEWNNEASNGLCVDVMPRIKRGAIELIERPDLYKQYESPNGWGTVGGCCRFFSAVLDDWQKFCEQYPELADVVYFYID